MMRKRNDHGRKGRSGAARWIAGGSILLSITVATVAVFAAGDMMDETFGQYQETREWRNTAFAGEMKDVPPFLAENYIQDEDRDAVEAWQAVEDALDEIRVAGRIPEGELDGYRDILDLSVSKQEAYKLGSGDITYANERLGLYIELEEALSSAYSHPDPSRLDALCGRLVSLGLESQDEGDGIYMERLKAAAGDYQSLSDFLSGPAASLGEFRDGVLYVDESVGEPQGQEALAAAEPLRKFPLVDSLHSLLSGGEWKAAVARNESAWDYYGWQEAKPSLESVWKSGYLAVSDIKTYQQALDLGLSVKTVEKDGYSIDPESPVKSVSYYGTRLADGQYLRKGARAVAELEEKYIKDEEPDYRLPYVSGRDDDDNRDDGDSSRGGSTGTHTPWDPDGSMDGPDEGSNGDGSGTDLDGDRDPGGHWLFPDDGAGGFHY